MIVEFQLHRNPFGQLVFTGADGSEHVDVRPTRAFPITSPGEGISIIGTDGGELAWISCLADLSDEVRRLVEDELGTREFIPVIERITGVSGYATPSTWRVETDRGPTSMVLNAEEDIRRLAPPALLIVDSLGIQFLIRDPRALDAGSRRILNRFM